MDEVREFGGDLGRRADEYAGVGLAQHRRVVERIAGGDDEVERVVSYLKSQGEPDYLDAVVEDIGETAAFGDDGDDNSGDELYGEAVALVLRERRASTSFVQRHLQIGYNRAARIIETMESEGLISQADRVGRREVLAGETV